MRIAFPALLRRFPNLALAGPAEDIRFRPNNAVYGVEVPHEAAEYAEYAEYADYLVVPNVDALQAAVVPAGGPEVIRAPRAVAALQRP